MGRFWTLVTSILTLHANALAPVDSRLQACGQAYYYPEKYTCYNDFLCPITQGQALMRCGSDCYLPQEYSCANGRLVQQAQASTTANEQGPQPTGPPQRCADNATAFALSDTPYENYFYSDCRSASQVVVSSPEPDSNLTLIGPRLLIAWPAGDSGVVAFFAPQNGINGSLGIHLVNYTTAPTPLRPIYAPQANGIARYGISGLLHLNSSASMPVAILGSIRNIRDFTEGPSILVPLIQDATHYTANETGIMLSRRWLDNVTTTELVLSPMGDGAQVPVLQNKTLNFEAGTYEFKASFNYPQLTQLSAQQVVNPGSQSLIADQPDQTKSLAFLSYSEKLLAGAWRFLTYFGRDSMISLLLLRPVLSEGKGGAIEAIIAAVLERVNSTDGSVCHEETIGDYATYLHLTQENKTSTAPSCTYVMIDTDYYLPIVLADYLLDTSVGQQRSQDFLNTKAVLDFGNMGRKYADLAQLTAARIMGIAAPFAATGNQTLQNLAHLKPDAPSGEWRDSTYGIGGGRIPFDVNAALVPAALRAIARLSEAGIFNLNTGWATMAIQYADVWESKAPAFFNVSVPASDARSRLRTYVKEANITVPANADMIPVSHPVEFYAVALNGTSDQEVVRVMHTDTAFRLFLLNSTYDDGDTTMLRQTASQILAPFPVGLSSGVGLLVANPAYGGDPVYAANFSRAEYHGTVVWGWPMAMMAKGLERQLDRCQPPDQPVPGWCSDTTEDGVYSLVRRAYNHLWDLLDANRSYLSGEVWSWNFVDGRYMYEPLGSFSPTESNVRQLWSLTYLAVRRNEALR